ncbi:P74 [Homarus gammarus nudivirus]|uniref:P74 n=1 Tax=Homarus gammarus nudivirus TaxID=2509616 RepID=A0A411HB98_9VIRU|nr:P74 [Homarus gammarus nudivirus]QBB28668.1 P74 [Homarus gammarus nudivirus]
MSYTNKDLDNGITYSNNRYKLRLINILFKKHPQLVSHMKYSIEQADSDRDYYYTDDFKTKAIKVSTKIPKYFCDKLSCNAVRAESSCTRDTTASYYIVGDVANFQRQCEPSCFHLLEDPVIDEETGSEQVQMLRLAYNDAYGCILLPTAYAWHEHPFYRSETVYEHRLNDLPAGFNADVPNPLTYSGMTYKYNKSYCDAYYDTWSDEKQTCVKKWWETVLYAVVGESIIKTVKAGIVTVENGYKSDYPPVSFPPIPPIEPEWTVLGWKKDINEDFIVPPIDYEIPANYMIQREVSDKNHKKLSQNKYEQNIEFIKQLKTKRKQISSNLRRKIEKHYDVKLDIEAMSEIKRVKDISSRVKTFKDIPIRLVNNKTGDEDDIGTILSQIIDGLLESVFTPDFWIDIGIGVLSDVILDQMKVVFRKLANDIIPKLAANIIKISGKLFAEVFSKTIISTITTTMSKIVVKTISKVMIQLAKLAAEIASVIGIILAIITIFDILLSLWDPLGFNNKFDQEIINSVTSSSDTAMRKSLGVSVPEMTFELFANMVLTPEEIIDESLHSFTYIYDYLNSLTINSEGSRINKGDELNFNDNTDFDNSGQPIVNTKQITPKELYDYEINHTHRMKYFKTSMGITVGLITVSCLFMVLDMWLVSILFFFITLITLMFSYFNCDFINVGKYVNDTLDMKSIL